MDSEESPWGGEPQVLTPSSNSTVTSLEYFYAAVDYFCIPLSIAAIVANIVLIVNILKYRKLKIRTNLFLINFAVSHIFYILSTPVLFEFILDIFFDENMRMHWSCVLMRVENFAMGLAFSFIGTFGIDSFLEKVKPSWFGKYKERYLYVFSAFYFGHFLIYLISASICLKSGFANNFNFYFLSSYFLVIIISVFYIIHKERNLEKTLKLSTPHKAYALTLSLIILLLWMPLITYYNLMIIFHDVQPVEEILWYTVFLPEYLAYCCPFVIITMLYRADKYFQTAFRKMFRRPVLDSDVIELNNDYNQEVINKL